MTLYLLVLGPKIQKISLGPSQSLNDPAALLVVPEVLAGTAAQMISDLIHLVSDI